MIGLVALILAGVVDAGDARRTTARVNEVRNRLGLREDRPPAGLRARIEWALRTYPDGRTHLLIWDVVVRRVVFKGGVWRQEQHVARTYRHDAEPISWDLDRYNRPLLSTWRMPMDDVWMPEPELRATWLEPLIPWLARELHGLRDDAENPEWYRLINHDTPEWSRLIDWVGQMGPDLFRYTVPGAIEASRRWHDSLKGKAGYRETARQHGIVVARWPDGAVVERLVTPLQLEEEGDAMGHCVGGYWPDVREGRTSIYSYRDPAGVPQATLEIRFEIHLEPGDGRARRLIGIRQLQGPDDSAITDPAAAHRLLSWLVHSKQWDHDRVALDLRPHVVLPKILSFRDRMLHGGQRIEDLRNKHDAADLLVGKLTRDPEQWDDLGLSSPYEDEPLPENADEIVLAVYGDLMPDVLRFVKDSFGVTIEGTYVDDAVGIGEHLEIYMAEVDGDEGTLFGVARVKIGVRESGPPGLDWWIHDFATGRPVSHHGSLWGTLTEISRIRRQTVLRQWFEEDRPQETQDTFLYVQDDLARHGLVLRTEKDGRTVWRMP
jgi:hypothetical protein